jgi:hypothetical protein
VSQLVVGDTPALGGADHPRSALETHRHPVDRLLELVHLDRGLAAAGGKQGCLVDHVGQLGAGEAGRAGRHDVEIYVGRKPDAAGVHREDRGAPAPVGSIDDDLAVEAPGAQQRP